jgi:zinc D-Ala-D-Ala carboxypeptidase
MNMRRTRKKEKNSSKVLMSIAAAVIIVAAVVVFILLNNQNNDLKSSEPNPIQQQNEASTEVVATEKEETETAVEKENDEKHSTNNTYIEGQLDPTEPTYINGILVVNKQYPIPSTYDQGVNPEAEQALNEMIQTAKDAGHAVEAFSSFRSFEYQTTLYNRYVNRDGKEAADRYSARPGYSEHQTGLAFDLGGTGQQDLWLTEAFGETPAGKWLMENAHQYGFILRYPKDKEHITGFMYESWHYRYVGIEHAKKIFEKNITLEEYLKID